MHQPRRRPAAQGYLGRTIGIKLRFDDFRTVTRDLTLPDPTADAAAIRRAAGECLRRVPLDRKLRLLGVRASALLRRDERLKAAAGSFAGRTAAPGTGLPRRRLRRSRSLPRISRMTGILFRFVIIDEAPARHPPDRQSDRVLLEKKRPPHIRQAGTTP
jgi:hypothetical protein